MVKILRKQLVKRKNTNKDVVKCYTIFFALKCTLKFSYAHMLNWLQAYVLAYVL